MNKRYLSYTMALILQAVHNGYRHGFDIMTITGLPSGTVYPALRRLEDASLVTSKWESPRVSQAAPRPARKYYETTKAGQDALTDARQRFRLLTHLDPVSHDPALEKG
jgi:DNA-binding PadR family transcriptional regulator